MPPGKKVGEGSRKGVGRGENELVLLLRVPPPTYVRISWVCELSPGDLNIGKGASEANFGRVACVARVSNLWVPHVPISSLATTRDPPI